jgi:cyclopropane-fatty-acyl-phospholipid synthase
VSETLTEMERAGWELLDLENLRLHYARTCRHWAERLKARADEAREIVGEQTYRVWLLYLICSSVAFATGSIGLYQILMQKQWDQARGPNPPIREGIYAGW